MNIVNLFASISIVVLNMYFLYCILETKISLKEQIIFGSNFILSNTIYYNIDLAYRPYLAVTMSIIYASLVFAGTFKDYITWSITVVVLDGIIEIWVTCLYTLIINLSIIDLNSNKLTNILAILISRLLLFLYIYFVTKKFDKRPIISKYSGLFVVFPIGCFSIVYLLFMYKDKLVYKNTELLLFLVSNVLLIIIFNAIVLYNEIISDAKQLSIYSLKLKTIEMTQSHINDVNNIYDKVTKIKHDLNNHFIVINGYVKNKNLDSLTLYMETLGQFDFNINLYSKQPIINTLISSFVCKAKNENIKFDFDIQLPKELPLNDVEICILFSNILENAFEANKFISENKYVTLEIFANKVYLQINCKNSNYTHENIKITDSLKTTKNKKELHGIGIKQIKEIVENNGGYINFSCDNYNFCTLVMIKLA